MLLGENVSLAAILASEKRAKKRKFFFDTASPLLLFRLNGLLILLEATHVYLCSPQPVYRL